MGIVAVFRDLEKESIEMNRFIRPIVGNYP